MVLAGRYALLRKLGEGRTAVAWLARDRDAGADIVVKVLREELSSLPAERERFLESARLQRDIAHPSVSACTGVSEDGPLLATFAYEGSSDLTRLRGAPLHEVLRALIQVADGAAALHARGLVHRDIKSSNVLLAEDGRALLSDFGLAAAIGGATATPGGSPFTASPGQLAGEPPAVADDVYSLGALAHELLTGYPPFYPDAAAARAASSPPSLAGRLAGAPPALEQLVTRCLARQGGDRPCDMAEVIGCLRAVADGNAAAAPARATNTPPAAPALQVPEQGAAAIEPMWQRQVSTGPSAAELRAQGFRRGLLLGSLVFLLAVAGLVFFALPQWVARHDVAPVPQSPASPTEAGPPPVAATVPDRDTQAETRRAEQKAQEQRVAAELRVALAAGAAAIDAGDSAEARRQYGIAAKIDPANAGSAPRAQACGDAGRGTHAAGAGRGIRAQRPDPGGGAGLAEGARARSGHRRRA